MQKGDAFPLLCKASENETSLCHRTWFGRKSRPRKQRCPRTDNPEKKNIQQGPINSKNHNSSINSKLTLKLIKEVWEWDEMQSGLTMITYLYLYLHSNNSFRHLISFLQIDTSCQRGERNELKHFGFFNLKCNLWAAFSFHNCCISETPQSKKIHFNWTWVSS